MQHTDGTVQSAAGKEVNGKTFGSDSKKNHRIIVAGKIPRIIQANCQPIATVTANHAPQCHIHAVLGRLWLHQESDPFSGDGNIFL